MSTAKTGVDATTSASSSIFAQAAPSLSDGLRSFVLSALAEGVSLEPSGTEGHVNFTATQLQVTVLDSWADSEEWELALACAASLEAILLEAGESHPFLPLPGPDGLTQKLAAFLATTLASGVEVGDIDSLEDECQNAARIMSTWCESPLIAD